MNNQFSIYDLLIIFGIIQAIIISILLLFSKKNERSNKFLALTVLAFSLLTSKTLLHTLHLWDTNTFRYFPNGIELALPPLIYFYAISLINPNFRFKPTNWIHFIPFFLAQTYAFVVYFFTLTTFDFGEKDSIAKGFWFNQVKQVEEYLLMISLVIYLVYGYQKIMDYKKWLNQTTSDSTYPDFSWLITIFRIFMMVGLMKLFIHFFDVFFDIGSFSHLLWNSLILIITGLIYYLGFKGLLLPGYSFSRDEVVLENQSSSNLPDSKLVETADLLLQIMKKDKVYLKPKLTLQELSKALGTTERFLSQVINQHFKMSFRDFINGYRLEEAKSKLKDQNFSHMSILGIAQECGFNSEASFYRIFRNNTGLSPKEFIRKSE